MRILFIAHLSSPLAARWITQLNCTGWDVHLFGTQDNVHPLFSGVTVHTIRPLKRPRPKDVEYHSFVPFRRGIGFLKRHFPNLSKALVVEPVDAISLLIRKIKPDCVHSLKMQNEGYYTLDTYKKLGYPKIPWIHSVWGSDIYPHINYPDRILRIREVLSNCHYLMAGNSRDITLSKQHCFRGELLGNFPSGGGYSFQDMDYLITSEPSRRNIITIKGYQAEPGGQALTALEAIKRCGPIFDGFRLVVHSALDNYAAKRFADVKAKAEQVSDICNVPVEFLPWGLPEKVWSVFAKSRLAIAISSTDGTPNAMLEAMSMGAFPIQSDTGGLDTWIQHGVNGMLVDYRDADTISDAITTAVKNNDLVDEAAKINREMTRRRLDRNIMREQVIKCYEYICKKIE